MARVDLPAVVDGMTDTRGMNDELPITSTILLTVARYHVWTTAKVSISASAHKFATY